MESDIPPQPEREGFTGSKDRQWQFVLKAVRQLMEQALGVVDIPRDSLAWTEMRWDVPDITVAWRNALNRNLHAVASGQWPSFRADFEGAVWKDNEETLERRVRFFAGPFAYLRAQGPVESMEFGVYPEGDVLKYLQEFVVTVNAAELSPAASGYPLQPEPLAFRSLGG